MENQRARKLHWVKTTSGSLVAGVIIVAAQAVSAAVSCDITFRVVSATDSSLLAVVVVVDYSDAMGEFEGQLADVNCESLVPVGAAGFVDNDIAESLNLSIAGTQGTLTVPKDLARCRFLPFASDPMPADFDASVTSAFGSTGRPVAATVQVSDVTCEDTGPTPACGDPDGNGVTATDALFLLGAAVGLQNCDPCVCDVDGSAVIAASDALRVLQIAVGLLATLNCPLCAG